MDDQERFIAETQSEAHYWFVVSDFTNLSLNYGLDKVLIDVLQLMKQRKQKELS